MKRLLALAWLAAMATVPMTQPAHAQRAEYDSLIATHARANGVPEALVHRVIVRESKYQAHLVGRGGTIGLMQIKLATARGVGYKGDAEGLRDPDTNLAYGTKYLAGAYRAAKGDHDRAVHYFASGYYQVAKAQRMERMRHGEPLLASAPPRDAVNSADTAKAADATAEQAAAKPSEIAKEMATEAAQPAEARPDPAETAKPKQAKAPPKQIIKPKQLAAKPNGKKLAEAKALVPRPPAGIPSGANAAKPR